MRTETQKKQKRLLLVLAAIAVLLALALVWFALNTGEYSPSGSAKFVYAGDTVCA